MCIALHGYAHDDTIPPTPPTKQPLKLILIPSASNVPATICACAFFVFVMLIVPQPIGVHLLNQLTSCSVRFNSCSYASLPVEMTSVFNRFESEKLKVSSLVVNLVKKKKKNQNFWEEYTKMLPCNVCFLGLFCLPWGDVQRRMMPPLDVSH